MELGLDEVLKNMKELKHRYKIKCVMYNENQLRASLRAIQPKDLNVSGGRRNNDEILSMLIKKENLSNSLEEIKESYNLYRELAINILVDYATKMGIEEMIIIYREKMHFKWEDIAWLTGYSRRQVLRIYQNGTP